MKNRLDNVIKIIKDNSKIIVPSIVAILLLIVIFITLYFYKYNSYHKDEELEFYNYITNTKNEFTGVLSRNRKGEIISLSIDKDTVIKSYPIYNRDKKLVIFPSKMNIVYATNELVQYSSNPYSYLYYDVNDYKFLDKGFNDEIKHSFLYDGNNIYFFLDKVNININGEDIELSPLSFVIANNGNNINYYDYDKDEFTSIDYNLSDIVVSNDYYNINVMEDKLNYYGNNVLLINDLDYLNLISDKYKK